MTSHIAKRVSDSQPAVVLATTLSAVCLNHRWPVVAAVFIVLQLGIILAAWGGRHPRARQTGVRFLARASAIAQPMTEPAHRTRPHLRLVP
jgi:hypothetical protein